MRLKWRMKWQRIISRIMCAHSYEIVSETVIPSEVDMLIEHNKKPNTHCSTVRKYVTDYKCGYCGKTYTKIVKTAT